MNIAIEFKNIKKAYGNKVILDGFHLSVAQGEFDRGILVCGTGLGMSVTANKTKGIRAVSIENTYSARVSRAHNNSNVLCLGERVIGDYLALDIVDIWLKTGFEGGRHKKRIDMIE